MLYAHLYTVVNIQLLNFLIMGNVKQTKRPGTLAKQTFYLVATGDKAKGKGMRSSCLCPSLALPMRYSHN